MILIFDKRIPFAEGLCMLLERVEERLGVGPCDSCSLDSRGVLEIRVCLDLARFWNYFFERFVKIEAPSFMPLVSC